MHAHDLEGISPAALRVLAGKCLDEHPEWADGEILSRLAIACPGRQPGDLQPVLSAALTAAKAEREALETLRGLWGDRYGLTWAPGRYIAVSRDEGKRTFTAGSPRELEAALRDDYAGGPS